MTDTKGRKQRADAVRALKEKVDKANAIVFTEYQGLSATRIAELRTELRGLGAEASVAKNTLMTRAVDQEDLDLSVTYALMYINTMCNFSKLNDSVYIHISEDIPLKMHYSLDEKDSTESENYVKFYLAPKIDDDDD